VPWDARHTDVAMLLAEGLPDSEIGQWLLLRTDVMALYRSTGPWSRPGLRTGPWCGARARP